jgi:hypothetical protein
MDGSCSRSCVSARPTGFEVCFSQGRLNARYELTARQTCKPISANPAIRGSALPGLNVFVPFLESQNDGRSRDGTTTLLAEQNHHPLQVSLRASDGAP